MWTIQSKKNNWTLSGVEILCNKLKSLFLKPLYVWMAAFCSPNSFLDLCSNWIFTCNSLKKSRQEPYNSLMTPLGVVNKDIKGSKLESTGAPIQLAHPSLIHMDMPCGLGCRCIRVRDQIFFFSFSNSVRYGLKQAPNRSDMGWNKCFKKTKM